MEFYTPDPFEKKQKPDETGESDTPKKKKKRTKRFPLPVEKSESGGQPKHEKRTKPFHAQEKRQKEADSTQKQLDKESKQNLSEEALELPEVPRENEFLGELIIDHTEDDEPEQVELVAETVLEAAEDYQADIMQPIEAYVETLEPTPAEAVEATSHIEQLPQEQSEIDRPAPQTVPMPDRIMTGYEQAQMFNPSEWRAVNLEPEEPVINEKEAHRRAHRAEKRGLSRGVVSGGLAGWWLGRRGARKSAEKRSAQAIASHEQAIDRLNTEYQSEQEISKKRQNALQRAQDELRRMIDHNRYTAALKRKEDLSIEAAQPQTVQEAAPSYPSVAIEAVKQTPEQPSLPVEERPITEEALTAPEGHRYETSAWHRIEIDEKTGRLVEKPAAEYGEAFQREQQQERLAREAAQAQTAAQLAVTFAAANNAAATPQSVLPPIESAPTRPTKISQVLQDTDYIKAQLVQQVSSPSTWGIALGIVAILLLTNIL